MKYLRLGLALTILAGAGNALSAPARIVEVGKRAELLLLRENPLEDIAAYDSIEYVIVGGKAIERSSLSALADM